MDTRPAPWVAESGRLKRPYRPLLAVAAACCAGLIADRQASSLFEAWRLWHWWIAAAIALIGAWHTGRADRRRLSVCLLLLAVLLCASAWSRLQWKWFATDDIGRFAAEQADLACVEATLLENPIVSPAPARDPLRPTPLGPMSEATVRITAIRDGRAWRSASGKARLNVAGKLCNVGPGDRLRIYARLRRPMPAVNPGQYDWESAERTARKLCDLYCSDLRCVRVQSTSSTSAWREGVLSFRRWCERQLAANIPWGEAQLPLAVLLGARENLSEQTIEAFRNTGTIHLLVVSGLHVGMVAGVVWFLAGAIGASLHLRVATTTAVVLIYAATVGANPPVIRAAALVILFLTGLASGRRSTQLNLLAAALIVVFVYNPAEFLRSGAQLSFLSVAALMLWGAWMSAPKPPDPLKRLLQQHAPWYSKVARRVSKYALIMAAASLIVWLTTFPLIAFHYNIATPIGVLIAPVIAPLVTAALASGLGAATLGWLAPPIAQLCGALCGVSLNITQAIVEWADSIRFGYFHTTGPQWWWVCGWYAGIGLFALAPSLRPRRAALAGLACLWISTSFAADGWGRLQAGDQLTCTFLAVGHGTCVVLELPGNQTVVYDAGSLGSPRHAAHIISSYLWSRRINHVDALVISHADIDHYNAVPRLLDRMSIDVVYVSPMMFDPLGDDAGQAAPEHLRKALLAADVPIREIWMGDRLRTQAGNVKIEVLHPPEFGYLGRDNANSVVLAVTFEGRRILLPGDLEAPGLDALMSNPPIDCDVLLAPHHGSDASDPPGFAAWSTPEWVVMSGRGGSGTSAASDSYRSAGAQALHTSETGAVTFRLTEEGLEVAPFRKTKASD